MVLSSDAPASLGPVEQPRYAQLARVVRADIEQGVLRLGDRLPGERDLSRRFGFSRGTVRRALVELEEQGCVRAAGTRGWFVAALVEPNVLMGFTDLADRRGFVTSSRVLASEVRPPTLDEAEALAAPPGAEVLELERVRMMDGAPVGWQRTIVALWLTPSLAQQDFASASLYRVLREDGIAPTRAVYDVSSGLADTRRAAHLRVPKGTNVLVVRALASDQHRRPIERSEGAFLGDRYRFSASVSSDPNSAVT